MAALCIPSLRRLLFSWSRVVRATPPGPEEPSSSVSTTPGAVSPRMPHGDVERISSKRCPPSCATWASHAVWVHSSAQTSHGVRPGEKKSRAMRTRTASRSVRAGRSYSAFYTRTHPSTECRACTCDVAQMTFEFAQGTSRHAEGNRSRSSRALVLRHGTGQSSSSKVLDPRIIAARAMPAAAALRTILPCPSRCWCYQRACLCLATANADNVGPLELIDHKTRTHVLRRPSDAMCQRGRLSRTIRFSCGK